MEAAAAIAPAMTEPFSSQMTGPVEPVLKSGNLASKMQYQLEATQLGRCITQIILTSPEPETVLPKLASALGKFFRADTCLVVAGINPQHTPDLAYWRAIDDLVVEPQHSWQLLDHPALAAVLANPSLLTVPDLQESQNWPSVGLSWEAMPIQAVLGIQTCCHFAANGAIVLGRLQSSDWTDREKELLKLVSDEVAIAISQIHLQQQVRTATKYQTLINQIALALQSGREMEQILQILMQATAQTLAVDRGFIVLLKYANPLQGKRKPDAISRRNEESHPASTELRKRQLPKAKATIVCEWLSTSEELGEKRHPSNIESQDIGISSESSCSTISLLNHSFWLSECSLCQQAFQNAPDPVAIADRRKEPLMEPCAGIAQISEGDAMPAILMLPLESQGTVLGFLVLQHCQPRYWQLQELELMKWVSAQASTAIIQAQTLRQVQAIVEERTSQLQRSLEVQAKLYEKTRQQIDQLRHLNQLKDEFLAAVSHELKTPLTTMSVAIELLRQPGLPLELRAKYVDILKQQCTQEINLINDLLALQELESHKQPVNLQKIDLKQVILNLAATFEQQWADKGLTLVVDLPKGYGEIEEPNLIPTSGQHSEVAEGKASTRSLILQTDPDSLNRILLELLTNAGKYSEPDSTVRLRVTQQVHQEINQIILSLSNTGLGISPTEITYIFDKFRRGQGVTQQAVQGTGLGLALVKSLVQHLNGTIDVSSCSSEKTQSCETCFTLTLPQFFDSAKV